MLNRIFNVQYPYQDSEAHLRARSVLFLSTVLIFVSLLILLSTISTIVIEGAEFSELVPVIAIAIGVMIWLRYLVQRGEQVTASYLFVILMTGVYLVVFLIEPRIDADIVVSMSIPIVITALLLGTRAMMLNTLVISSIVVFVYLYQQITNTFPAPRSVSENSYYIIQNLLTEFILVSIVLYYFLTNSRKLDESNTQMKHFARRFHEASQTLQAQNFAFQSLDKLVQYIQDLFQLVDARIYLPDKGGEYLVLEAGSVGAAAKTMLQFDVTHNCAPAWSYRLKEAAVTTLDDIPEKRETFQPGTQVELTLPLTASENEALGVLDLQSANPEAFNPHEVILFEVLSNQLALIIKQQQIQNTLDKALQELEIQAAEARHQARRERNLSTLSDWATYLRRHQVAAFQWSNGQTESWQPDSEPPPPVRHSQIKNENGLNRLMVPIYAGNKLVGEIVFEADETTSWSEKTLELAQSVANRLALALENARLIDSVQSNAVREQTVNTVVSNIQGIRDMQTLLNSAAEVFNQSLGTQHTHIRLGLLNGEQNEPSYQPQSASGRRSAD
jgi:GAF domain-containing protein